MKIRPATVCLSYPIHSLVANFLLSTTSAAAVGLFASLVAGAAMAQQIIAKPVVQSSWSGFGADFKPNWVGSTERVDFPLGNPGGGTATIGPDAPSWPLQHPISLLYANRSHLLYTSASVGWVRTSSNHHYLVRDKGASTTKEARFARIINLQDLVVDQASAVAEMTSTVLDNSLNVTGRLSSAATIAPGALGAGSASASVTAVLEAAYFVSSPLAFTLKGKLSRSAAVDLTFHLYDGDHRELYSLTAPSNGAWAFDLSGILTPGSYKIEVSGQVEANVYEDAGGMGEYSVAFQTTAPLTADFTGDGRVDASDLAKWRGNFRVNGGSDADGDGDSDGNDILACSGS